MTRLDKALYRMAFWFAWHGIFWPSAILYRFRCPSPIGGLTKPRDCIAAGNCGCDNDKSPGRSAMLRTAPEMHAILCELVNPDDFDQHPQDFADVWHRARAIISKAEGFA